MRIAFLTTEFVTEHASRGGLASYLDRMTGALVDRGHDVEVFTLAAGEVGVVRRRGVRVERVRPARHYGLRLLGGLSGLYWRTKLATTPEVLDQALALARAFHARDRAHPFHVVQSADYRGCGLFIRRRPGLVHVIRCSWSPELYDEADGRRERFDVRVRHGLERMALRRAHGVYAPSAFLAAHLRRAHGIPAAVVRPPLPEFPRRPAARSEDLPARYLVHFGQIGARKGSDLIAKALPLAWRTAPGLEMVWAGREIGRRTFEKLRARWGERADQVRWLGPIDRERLLGIVAGAVAAVLPSRVDNLPNTVIESLSLGVPVIGSAGASIDELVVHGENGELVPIGDEAALASAMSRAWRGEAAWPAGELRPSPALAEMSPDRAVHHLIAFAAGLAPRGGRPTPEAPAMAGAAGAPIR